MSIKLEAVLTATDRATPKLKSAQAAAISMTSHLRGGLRALDSTIASVGAGLKTVALATTAATVGVGLAAKELLTSSAVIDDGLAKVGSVITPMAGTVEDATGRMKTAAIAWSKSHRDSAASFLDTSYQMISAGLNEQQALSGTRTAMQLATATFGDHTAAAGLLATVYNNMGDKTADAQKEMERLGDVITKTQQTFQFADLNQLNEGLKFGIPTALQYGIQLEELSTVIGVLNNAGLQGSMAGTAFGGAMRNMTKASKDLGFAIEKNADGGVNFTRTIQNIETKFGSLASMSDTTKTKFQQAFGDEGFRALSLMIGKSDGLVDGLDKVGDHAGAAATATALIESKGTARWGIVRNRVEALKVSIGDSLAPAADRLVGIFERAVGATDDWVSSNDKLIGTKLGETLDEWLPLAENFGDGVKDALSDVAPLVKTVAGGINKLFGNESESARTEAYLLGNDVANLGLAFVGYSLATKAAAAWTVGFTIVTKAGKALVWTYEAAIGAAKAAQIGYTIWTRAGTAATIAMSGASVIATGNLWKQRAAAFGAAGGWKKLGGAIGVAGVALLAYQAIDEQNEALKKETEGLGILDIAGGMIDKGTWDPFKVVDEHQNKLAKDRAAQRDGKGGKRPGEALDNLLSTTFDDQDDLLASVGLGGLPSDDDLRSHLGLLHTLPPPVDYAPTPVPAAIPPSQHRGPSRAEFQDMVKQSIELTIKAPKDSVEVTKKPSGAKVNVQPSGDPLQ